ncbi:MAG: prephenate dehydrogenase/arogenate dehydrogenase family protein [Proteobacteria bacterium]|nr:prephenate dehydrogenase/arogenate dehydrogenase family protein [Pseudomonadota bacterium]
MAAPAPPAGPAAGAAPLAIGKLVVVGVGLIGGSCALALRANAAVTVREIVGVGRSRANLDDALARRIVDRVRTLDEPWGTELADADVVLVAAPVAQYTSLFRVIAAHAGQGTLVTDAGSTKSDVVATARSELGGMLARVVPAHPIAGSHHSGASAADATLYRGRTVIVTPLAENAPDAVARIEAVWRACGARVSTLDPALHDRILAAVSHLPHVIAHAYLAELAGRRDAASFLAYAGSGFRDFTRLGGSSPEVWRDITLANRHALLAEIAAFRDALDGVARLIDAGDAAALEALFARSRDARREWEATMSGKGP